MGDPAPAFRYGRTSGKRSVSRRAGGSTLEGPLLPTLLGIRAFLLSLATLACVASTAAAAAGPTTHTLLPPPAQATPNGPGMYHAYSCRTPSGAPASVEGWADWTYNSCGDDNGSFGVMAGDLVSLNEPGARNMTWTPKPSLRGVSLELLRTAQATAGTVDAYATLMMQFQSGAFLIQTYQEMLHSQGTPGAKVGTDTPARAADNRVVVDPFPAGPQDTPVPIIVGASCWDHTLGDGCVARYSIFSADFRIQDLTKPAAGTPRGTLTAAMRPELPPQSGTLGFSVPVSDAGSGVLRMVVEVDGKAAVSAWAVPGSPTCTLDTAADGLRAYPAQVPCPPTGTIADVWDTRTATNGSHDVRLLVEDAAGNSAVAAAGKVLVANPVKGPDPTTPTTPLAPATPDQSVGPGTPDVIRGEPNGSAAGAQAGDTGQLSLTWPATARAPSKKPSVIKHCTVGSYAKKHPLDCVGRPATSTLQRPWSAKASDRLVVMLRSSDGTPIAGARVQLQSVPAAIGAAPSELPVVVTGADGTADVAVARADGSRSLTATWRARAADTVPGAKAAAALSIEASTTFSAPRRVGPSARVKFSGTLRGPAALLGAVPITLQVFNQGRWKTFETATSDQTGRWAARVIFAPRSGIYPVRVKVGKSPTFPFAPGVAAGGRVRVS